VFTGSQNVLHFGILEGLSVKGAKRSLHAEALQATVSEGLAQGPSHLWRPQKIGFLTPLALSTCVHMGWTPLPPCGRPHAVDMKYTPPPLEMASTMTYRT